MSRENRPVPQLIGDDELERYPVVANRDMNRNRGLHGRDGYSRVLGVDLLALLHQAAAHRELVRWLDLCCGSGIALLDAARALPDNVEITGVDLVDFYAIQPAPQVQLMTASITTWRPDRHFDLITCVHGLHYIGDKLATLAVAASWLTEDGLLIANFDATSIRLPTGAPAARQLATALRDTGWTYDGRRHRIRRTGHSHHELPFGYLGADPRAGPNYTGQPAVHSYYRRTGQLTAKA